MGLTVFPVGQLLRLTGKLELEWHGDFCWTDLSKEMDSFQTTLKRLKSRKRSTAANAQYTMSRGKYNAVVIHLKSVRRLTGPV